VDNEIGAQVVTALAGIVRTSRGWETSAEQADDVPTSVIAVLGLLADNGELRLGSLAAGLFLDTSVISRTVAAAVDRGLVARRPDPRDGRACLLSVTAQGRQCLADRRNRRLRLFSGALDDWEPGAAEALLTGLTRLRDGLAHARNEPPAAVPRPAAAVV
jgi:DNA-binding MarR family transcriptional regulator